MAYYGRRRRTNWNKPHTPVTKTSGPIEVDIESMINAVNANAPSHRATTTSALTVTVQQTGYAGDRRWRRNIVVLYDGRKKVEKIDNNRVVIITYETFGWRISTSTTAEPTPMLIRQGSAPEGSDKIAESGGMTIYQTPSSMLQAALYQATHNRRAIALAMIDEAIALKGKSATPEQVDMIERRYKAFCGLSAMALGASNLGEGNTTDAVVNEAVVGFKMAVKRGASIIEGEWA